MRSYINSSLRVSAALGLCWAVMLMAPVLARPNIPLPGFILEPNTKVTWETDLDQAVGLSRISLKPIIVFFTLPNSPDCLRLKQFTLENSLLQTPLRKFERVETDLAQRPELAMVFHISQVPTLVIVESDGRIRDSMEGYRTAKEVNAFLTRFIDRYLQSEDLLPVIDELKTGHASGEQWRKALLAMGEPNARRTLQLLAGSLSEKDRSHLAACLGDERLSVRLGALDLLEELNSSPPAFDPWADLNLPEQKSALAAWDLWARSGGAGGTPPTGMTRQDVDRHIRDVIGDDQERARVAMHALYNGGKPVAGWLVDYVKTTPELNENALRRIKEVQYALVIPPSAGIEPLSLAHRILWGNQDVRIRSIRQLADCGFGPSAILVDLLKHPDTLIRETAVDVLFQTAGDRAVPHIKDFLATEKDPDIIFAVLRHLADTKSFDSQTILESYFNHENEDLVIAAIEGVVEISVRSLGSKMVPLLKDKRWRVRVAALDAICKKGGPDSDLVDNFRGKKITVSRQVSDPVVACLDDPDEFVRHTAAATLGELKADHAVGDLKKAYNTYPEMHGIVLNTLIELNADIPDSFVDDLFGPEPDELLSVLSRVDSLDGSGRKLAHRAVDSDNPDVSCSALRIIAKSETRNSSDNAILVKALQSGSNEKRLTVIQEFDMDTDHRDKIQQAINQTEPATKTGNLFSGTSDTDVLVAMAGLLDLPGVSGPVRNDAMITLCGYGHRKAFDNAVAGWNELTSSMKTKVVRSLSYFGAEGIPLFELALNDGNQDIWEAAVNKLSRGEKSLFAPSFCAFLSRPDCRLSPSVMWPEGIQSICRENPADLMPFARNVLADPSAYAKDKVILALTVLTFAKEQINEQGLLPELCKSPDPFIRRSAWIARIALLDTQWTAHVDTLVSDSSHYVRELAPSLLQNARYMGHDLDLYFSDEEWFTGYQGLHIEFGRNDVNSYEDFIKKPSLSEAHINLIKTLSQTDPDPMVRFKSSLCLLTYQIPCNLTDMVSDAGQCPHPKVIAELLARFFSSQEDNLGDSFKVLIPLMTTPDGQDYGSYVVERYLKIWGVTPSEGKASVISFEALPENKSETGVMATFIRRNPRDYMFLDEFPETEIHFFSSPDCLSCGFIEFWMKKSRGSSGESLMIRHNILTREDFILNEVLSQSFRLDEQDHAVAPSVFTSSGYLVGNEITWSAFSDLQSMAGDNLGAGHLFDVTPEKREAALVSATERANRISWTDLIKDGVAKGSHIVVIVMLMLVLNHLTRSGLGGKTLVSGGGFFFAGIAVTVVAIWIFPEQASALESGTVKVRNYLIFIIIAFIFLSIIRHFFKSFPRIRKKKTTPEKIKPPYKPGLKRVMAASAIWGILATLFSFMSVGNEKTATLIFMIKDHIMTVKPVVMIICYGLSFFVTPAAILCAFGLITANSEMKSFFERQKMVTNIILCLIWSYVFFRLVRSHLPF